MESKSRRLAILAEGSLDFHHGKTAASILRYKPEQVVAVIDRFHAGSTALAVLGIGGDTPIVSSIQDAMQFEPTALLIGIAPRGGGLPDDWRHQILYAIEHGLDIISGLHYVLSQDAEFVSAASRHGTRLSDVRVPPDGLGVAELWRRRHDCRVITFVGSDCAVGKMTAALECVAYARATGASAGFVATGQTGIMLEGSGIAIDRVIGDFMAGATERLVIEACERWDWIFVEGQGSLLHPAYSGVTLALLHGSAPDAMILVHQPGHDRIDEYPVPIPPLDQLIQIYETAAAWVRPAPVAAIALNTRLLSESAARAAIQDAADLTGLPAVDPVRFGAGPIVEPLMQRLVVQGVKGPSLDAHP